MESAQQRTGGAARCECQRSEGVRSARSDVGADNLINALKLLAIHQKDGDSPIQSIVTGLHERSRKVSWRG